ncbi:MAG: hypothetical protein K6T83_05700 [Alicyclobacillus sp.]|nr:hypothetical protein [Alicyclobacillus sp.]
MEQTYIIRYTNGSEWKVGAPVSKKLAEKHAELLTANGYQVEIVPADKPFQ